MKTIFDSSNFAMISCFASAATSHGVWPAMLNTKRGALWASSSYGGGGGGGEGGERGREEEKEGEREEGRERGRERRDRRG